MERALCHHKLERFIVKAVTTSHPNCSGRSENTDSGFDDGSATEGDMPDELSETISNVNDVDLFPASDGPLAYPNLVVKGQDRDEGQDDNEEEYYDAGDEVQQVETQQRNCSPNAFRVKLAAPDSSRKSIIWREMR